MTSPKELILYAVCILVYFIVTSAVIIVSYRKGDRKTCKGWLPWWILTFTGVAPVIIISLIAGFGLIGGIGWLIFEYLPQKLFGKDEEI